MKQYRSLFYFVILCCLLAVSTAVTFAAPQIKGTVVNGTNNVGLGGLTVELRRSGEPDKPGQLITTTTTDSKGQFTFTVPKAEHDSLLVAQVNYKNFPYEVPAYDGGKRLSQFNVNIDPNKVKLPVFDTTTSLIPLELSVSHVSVKPRPGGIACQEYLIVNNPTKKTFLGIGKDNATLLLDLPKNVKNVHLDEQTVEAGAKLNKRPDGYSVTLAIPPSLETPGTAIIIDYDMDWPSRLPWQRTVNMTREVQYPTRLFFVQRSANDRVLQVTGYLQADKDKTPFSGDQNVQLNFEGKPQDSVINSIGNPTEKESAIMPGDQLHIEISSPINPAFWAFSAFLILLIILIPFALWRRNSPATVVLEDTSDDKIAEPTQSQSVYHGTSEETHAGLSNSSLWLTNPAAVQLVEQIAALDDDNAAGRVSDEEYRTRRATYKRALMRIAAETGDDKIN